MHEQEMQSSAEHCRTPDELEAESVKYNVARIVRLTSGAFALFTHYREGSLDLVKVGTIEDLAPHIPTAEQCSFTAEPRRMAQAERTTKLTKLDLADLGL